MLRRMWAVNPTVKNCWNTVLAATCLKPLGPVSLFLLDLQLLGWTALPDGVVRLQDGVEAHVFFTDWSTVRPFAWDAWARHVVGFVSKKGDFHDLTNFSIALVRTRLSTPQGYNSHVANYAVGAIVPASRRKHFASSEDTNCPCCSAELTVAHMLTQCPATQHCWAPVLSELAMLQPAQIQHGLFSYPPEVFHLRAALAQFKTEPVACMFYDQDVHFFTDGSTIHPAEPTLTLSAWGVVAAVPDALDGVKLLNGLLPGGIQSNNRAELLAVIVAVQLGTGGSIYSDSDITVQGFNRLISEGWVPCNWLHSANLDLWFLLHESLSRSPRPWVIHKVKSHQDWRAAPNPRLAWLWYHNDLADSFAKEALKKAPQAILEAHKCAVTALRSLNNKQKQVYNLQKQVAEIFNGHRLTLNRPSSSPAEPHDDSLQLFLCRLGMLTADKGFPFPGLQQEPQWSSFVLCAPFGHLLYKWLCAHTWVPDEDSMSLLELYFAFTVDVGWLVPVNVAPWVSAKRPEQLRDSKLKAIWAHEVQFPELKCHRQSLRAQLVTFAHVLRAIMSMSSCPWKIAPSFALRAFGIPCKVPGLKFRLQALKPHTVALRMLKSIQGKPYRDFAKSPYVAPTAPLVNQLEFGDARTIFNCARRLHRQRPGQ